MGHEAFSSGSEIHASTRALFFLIVQQSVLCDILYRRDIETMESPRSSNDSTPGENGQPSADNNHHQQGNGRFHFKSDPERQSDKNDEEDELLVGVDRHSPPSDVVQPGVRFQQRHSHQHWKKSGVFGDGLISSHQHQHHHIKPLIKSPQHQPHHHRLSHNSLFGSSKSMDFGYEDERYYIYIPNHNLNLNSVSFNDEV